MRALHLDYQAAPPKPWTGIILLICGIALLAFTLLNYQHAVLDEATLEADIAKIRGAVVKDTQGRRQAPTESAQRKEEIATANGLIRQLTLPWEALFSTFELATNKDVALLSIEPDAKKRIVKVTAESKTVQGMLEYMKRLQKSPLLDEVVLQKHEVQMQDPEKPLRFIVTSVWKESE